MYRTTIRMVACIIASVASLPAQGVPLPHSGEIVRVSIASSRSDNRTAIFGSISGDSLKLRSAERGEDYAVLLSSVTKVEVRRTQNHILAGVLVGVTLGAVTGYSYGDDRGTRGPGDIFPPLGAGTKAALGGLFGGALGAVVGALVRTPAWNEVPLPGMRARVDAFSTSVGRPGLIVSVNF